MNEIMIYQSDDRKTQVEVRFKDETVWLNQEQLSDLFQRDQSVISRHVNNIFKEEELTPESNMQKIHNAGSDKPVTYYNLDVIISVGYRIKSGRGVQFRQWATSRLKEYLVEGYAINKKRLEERNLEFQHLKTGIAILSRAIEQQAQSLGETEHLAGFLEQFAGGLSLLDDYDHEMLDLKGNTKSGAVVVEAVEYRKLIDAMRREFASDLFGRESDAGFEGAVRQIYQCFGKVDLYPSVEEKAAMLLYLIVKNHPFLDGNKRIAAACFLYFLERNGILSMQSGEKIIGNNALAALTLFIAVSKPEEMQTVKQVTISILNRKNAGRSVEN